MAKVTKVITSTFIIFILIILLGLLFSPFLSLFLPIKLTNHIYYRLFYNLIADKESAGCENNQEKAVKLFQYVVNHEFTQRQPYKCKPMESLIYAEGYCDFQARTLNELLGIVGIPSRYAMLLDKDGVSPHTLNEVLLGQKWCVFDTSMNIIFEDASGNKLSLQQLSDNPNLIFRQRKLTALKDYDKAQFDAYAAWCRRMFPVPRQPRRSTPRIYQAHIIDYIADAYFKLFKHRFFNLYQDIYFNFKKKNFLPEDFRLFYMARNYQLAYRDTLALEGYNIFLEKFPASNYRGDVVFFCGILYFDKGDFPRAVKFFNEVLAKYPRWKQAAYYYLGRAFGFIRNCEAGLSAYRNAGIVKLSAGELEGLNKLKF